MSLINDVKNLILEFSDNPYRCDYITHKGTRCTRKNKIKGCCSQHNKIKLRQEGNNQPSQKSQIEEFYDMRYQIKLKLLYIKGFINLPLLDCDISENNRKSLQYYLGYVIDFCREKDYLCYRKLYSLKNSKDKYKYIVDCVMNIKDEKYKNDNSYYHMFRFKNNLDTFIKILEDIILKENSLSSNITELIKLINSSY